MHLLDNSVLVTALFPLDQLWESTVGFDGSSTRWL